MIKNFPSTFRGESAESFKNRVEKGLDKTAKTNNLFATLNPLDRVTYGASNRQVEKEDTLRKVLEQYGL